MQGFEAALLPKTKGDELAQSKLLVIPPLLFVDSRGLLGSIIPGLQLLLSSMTFQ